MGFSSLKKLGAFDSAVLESAALTSAFSGVGWVCRTDGRLVVFFGGIDPSSGSTSEDEQQLRNAKSLREVLGGFSDFAGSCTSGLTVLLFSSELGSSGFCSRDLMLLPLLLSLRPLKRLLREPRSVFSDPSCGPSWVLSEVDGLSAFKDVRDGRAKSRCFFGASAGGADGATSEG